MRIIGRVIYTLAWPFWFIYFKFSNNRCRVLLVHEDKILIVRGWLSSGEWNLPGGGMKKGENYTDAVSRELREETGINLSQEDFKDFGGLNHDAYGLNYKLHIFYAQLEDEVEITKQPIEILDAKWVRMGELDKFKLGSDVIYGIDKYRKNLL